MLLRRSDRLEHGFLTKVGCCLCVNTPVLHGGYSCTSEKPLHFYRLAAYVRYKISTMRAALQFRSRTCTVYSRAQLLGDRPRLRAEEKARNSIRPGGTPAAKGDWSSRGWRHVSMETASRLHDDVGGAKVTTVLDTAIVQLILSPIDTHNQRE
ncbi:hypothetical protein Bbelb_096500 [Branchiostoma belcheri]|nr:hypothetical protein Bbelb_096500 [Branchiostoma belcheri]